MRFAILLTRQESRRRCCHGMHLGFDPQGSTIASSAVVSFVFSMHLTKHGAAAEAAAEGQQWGAHLHPQLRSTRSLERFRNQVR